MIPAKEFKKIVQSAIIVMPPKAIWDPIQEIRKVHDKSYARWMPHINMIYPFIPSENFAEVVPKIQEALKPFSPFKVNFDDFQFFKHKGSCTMWLNPKTDSKKSIQDIQFALESAFPYCDEQGSKSEEGFTPHLSVGQWPFLEVKNAMAKFQSSWKSISFEAGEVYIIHRSDFEAPFEIYYRVPFGGGEPEKLKDPVPRAQKPVTEKKNQVFVGNLPYSVTDRDLESAFADAGFEAVTTAVIKGPDGRSKGFGFVGLKTAEDVQKAIKLSKVMVIGGREVNLNVAN